jgi:hypothetical protein
MGAAGTRPSLRPLLLFEGKLGDSSDAMRRENGNSWFAHTRHHKRRHCERSEAIDGPRKDCVCGSWIASRSLSSGAHSRDPLARNDGGLMLPRLVETSSRPSHAQALGLDQTSFCSGQKQQKTT